MSPTPADALSEGIEIKGKVTEACQTILSPQALQFIAKLHRTFDQRRRDLLHARVERQAQLDAGQVPDFLDETSHIREDSSWQVGSIPNDLQLRRVEITGPVERKMMINALNSGANLFMADFEDANSPTWENNMNGHINLKDAVNRTIALPPPPWQALSIERADGRAAGATAWLAPVRKTYCH